MTRPRIHLSPLGFDFLTPTELGMLLLAVIVSLSRIAGDEQPSGLWVFYLGFLVGVWFVVRLTPAIAGAGLMLFCEVLFWLF